MDTQVTSTPIVNVPKFTPAVLRSPDAMQNFLDDISMSLKLISKDAAMDLRVMASNDSEILVNMNAPSRNVKGEDITRDAGRGDSPKMGRAGRPVKFSDRKWDSDSLNVITKNPNTVKIAKQALVQILEDHTNLRQLRVIRETLITTKTAIDSMTGPTKNSMIRGSLAQINAIEKQCIQVFNSVYAKIKAFAVNHTPTAMKPWVVASGGRGLGLEDLMGEFLTFEKAAKMPFLYVAREGRHQGELVHVVNYQLSNVIDPIDNQPLKLNITLSYSQGVVYLHISQKYVFPGNFPMGIIVTKYEKLSAAFQHALQKAGISPDKSRTAHNYNLYLGMDDKDAIRRHGAKLSDIITGVDFDDDSGRYIVFYLKNGEVDLNMVMADIKKMASSLTQHFRDGVQWSVKKDANWRDTGKAVITLSLNNPPYSGIGIKDISFLQTTLDATDAEMQRILTVINDRGYDGNRNVKPRTAPDQKTMTSPPEAIDEPSYEGTPDVDINDFGQVQQFVRNDVRTNNNITTQPGQTKDQIQAEIIQAVMDWYSNTEVTSLDQVLEKIDQMIESWTGKIA